MAINQAFRYELKPNNKQRTLLVKHCGVARFAWNWALARRKELYRTHEGKERFTSAINQNKELNILKRTDYPWMYEVSKCSPQESLKDLEYAYSMMRRAKKNGNKIRGPKFKKRGVYDSFRLSNYNLRQTRPAIRIEGSQILLPKIGLVRSKEEPSKVRGRILFATISREVDRWFCSLCVEVDRPEPKLIQGDIVGIDLGISCFATISDGHGINDMHSPKPLRKNIIKVKRYHRHLDKKQKGSKNKKKAQLKLARLYRRIRNIRKDFLAKESSKLAKTKSVIVIEDLNVAGMIKNRHLSRSIDDEGWGTFRRMLEYKTKWYGSRLVVIPRFYPSSKRCNHCGAVNKDLKLSDRTWACLSCGTINERDPNAATNIRDYGIAILHTESSSGINACGVDVRLPAKEAIDSETGSKHVLDGQTYGTAVQRV